MILGKLESMPVQGPFMHVIE